MDDTVIESFRTAVAGFHKGDVTNYIARTAAEYDKKLKRQESENSFLRQKNELLESKLHEIENSTEDHQQELEALRLENADLKARNAALQEQLAASRKTAAELSAAASSGSEGITDMELAAYRRAESAERNAVERARRINREIESLFVSAVENYADTDAQIGTVMDALQAQITAIQDVRSRLDQSRNAVQRQFEAVCSREFFPLQKEEN